MMHELQGRYDSVLPAMKGKSLARATKIFMRRYEVCTDAQACLLQDRVDAAGRWLKYLRER
jgi:hypothetical protein